jgi:hypothetical protein
MAGRAVPAAPRPDPEELPERSYEVLVKNYVGGKRGDIVKLRITDNQELSLLQARTLKRAAETPVTVPVSLTRPDPANSEGK